MQLISDEYRKLNKEKHETSTVFGISGQKYVDEVLNLVEKLDTKDILDYGCGKSTLANCLPFTIKQYDPAIPKYEADPEPADIVVCTDVMEHIEPECLDNVLKHIQSKTKRVFYCSINTSPAIKHLPDGRNAHLIVEELPFWAAKLEEYFTILNIIRLQDELLILSKLKDDENGK